MAFLDTSILGSYYCAETKSAAVAHDLSSLRDAAISSWVELEFASVLSLKVRSKLLTPLLATGIWDQFQADIARQLYRMLLTLPKDQSLARQWVLGFKTPLRTLDSLHLACAANNAEELWTTDLPLAKGARLLGVRCHLIR